MVENIYKNIIPTDEEKLFRSYYSKGLQTKMKSLLTSGELSVDFLNNLLQTHSIGSTHAMRRKIKPIINIEGVDVYHKYKFLLETSLYGFVSVDFFNEFYNLFLKDERFNPSFGNNCLLIHLNNLSKEVGYKGTEHTLIKNILLKHPSVIDTIMELQQEEFYEYLPEEIKDIFIF